MSIERVRKAFADQATACTSLGSRFTGDLCALLGERLTTDTAVGAFCLNWTGDPSGAGDSIPLRLCGGLHALVITGKDGDLAAHYPPHQTSAPEWPVLEAAFIRHQAFFLEWLTSPPQTNEVSRSSVLWPSLMQISALTGLPLDLLEIGASGGLNLNCHRFGYNLGSQHYGAEDALPRLAPEWRGEAPVQSAVTVASSKGCDLNPIDVSDNFQALRLRSYVWPDQADRQLRLDQAIDMARQFPVEIVQCDALEFLSAELLLPTTGHCTVIYSTIAWQYLPEAARLEGERIIEENAKARSPDAPIAWLRFEADGETPGAGISLRLWSHHIDANLGRADFHGRWVEWHGL